MMMMMSEGTLVHHARTAGLLTATALAIASLTACSDNDPDPLFSTTTTSTSTSTSTDTPTKSPTTSTPSGPASSDDVPELPETAQKHTKAGAIAFNKAYQVQTGEAMHTGNTEFLKKYSDQECKVCIGMIDLVQKYADQGITTNKNPNSVRDATATKRPDDGYRVELTLVASEYHQVHADGSKGSTAQAVTMTIVSDTQWVDGHWQINEQVRVQ